MEGECPRYRCHFVTDDHSGIGYSQLKVFIPASRTTPRYSGTKMCFLLLRKQVFVYLFFKAKTTSWYLSWQLQRGSIQADSLTEAKSAKTSWPWGPRAWVLSSIWMRRRWEEAWDGAASGTGTGGEASVDCSGQQTTHKGEENEINRFFSVTLGPALYTSSRKESLRPFGSEKRAEVKGLKCLLLVLLTSLMAVIGGVISLLSLYCFLPSTLLPPIL